MLGHSVLTPFSAEIVSCSLACVAGDLFALNQVLCAGQRVIDLPEFVQQ
jgi:hypothetical protein